jgi:hypothetical protein
LIRLIVVSSLVAALVAVGGWWVAASRSPEWRGAVLWFSGGVNLSACWLAFVPIAWVRRKHATFAPQAALAATVIRLLVVASATMAGIRWGWYPFWPLAVWMMTFYLSLLLVETVLVVRVMREACASEGQVRAA